MQSIVGTATITGLQAGTYNVTVSDFTGCQQTCSFVIAGPVCNLNLNITGTAPACNGGNTGSIALVVNNANGASDFDWNVNALDGIQNPSNLTAGAYQVTVTDAAGCTANTSVTLTDPLVLVLACAQQNPASTVGGSDGSATIEITGGTAAYTIAWSGATSGSQNQATAGIATITGLTAGNYTVIVTDASGCTQACSFSIGDPNCNITVDALLTAPLCNGSMDGSIQLIVNNGTGNLNFEWNVTALDGQQNPSGLSAGNYAVTVTDDLNCTATTSANLTAPSPILLNCAQQNPVSTIGGSDGSATVQISGGTAGYTVAWSGAASGSQMQGTAGTATITGLIAGTYNVLVTDANGCEQTCTFSISFPACALDVTAVGTNPECNGEASGSIAVSITGATGTLTFDWNDNTLDGTEDPTGLLAGTYFLSVTDQGGCSDTITVTLTDPAALTLVCAQQNPVSTIGGSDGSATVEISGGTATYTVAWSGAASGSQMQGTAGTATITGLIAGTYNVLVTDANGCEQTCTFSISSPACALDVTAIGTDPECNGEASGSIAVSVTGATGTLTFDWNDNTLDGTEDPTGLLAGTYFLSVTDQGGCSDTITVTLTDPAALTLVCAQQNPVSTVGGSDGSATVEISGGTAAYTVAWSGAASGSQMQGTAGIATITGLIAGTYNVLVTDANGCEQTCTFSISSPACALDVTALGTDPECNGEASGGIAVSVTGATGTLTFDWNDNTLDGTEDPTGLLAGSYFLSVTDQGGCSDTITVTLTDPAALTLVCAQQNPVSSIGGSDGSATVQISGGTAAYTVAWSGAASGSQNQTTAGTATITGLIVGTYNVLVTDANGCEQTCTFSISFPACALDVTAVGTNPECNGEASGSIAVSITGATGTLTFDWNDNTLDGTEDPTGLLAGTYFLSVTDQGGCSDTITVTLTDPAALTLVCAQQNPVSTIGGSDGSATVQISGGTAAYTVAWSGAASGSQMQGTAGIATITGLIAGTYNVLVTDANGCEQTCTFSISSPACALDVTALGTDPECNGEASGSIAVSVTGATGTLTFDWNDNSLDGTEDPTGLLAGTYFLSVTDQGGCSDTITVTLNDPVALTLVCAQQNPVSTIGGSDGSATIEITGGTAAYTVAWSGAASGSQMQGTAGTATITGLIAGTYNILVIDANGCEQTCTFSISSPACALDVTALGTDPECNGEASGSIAVSISGATGTLTFDWSDNTLDGTEDPTGLLAGTYFLSVTDQGGCSDTITVTLNDPVALTLVCAQQNPVSTIGGSDGSATIEITGGTAPYTLAWSGAASGSQNQATAGTATITGLIAGTYNILVTDANGCEQTCTFSISSPACALDVTAIGTDPECNGEASGSIAVSVTGGTGTLTFDWSDNTLDGTEDPTGLLAGTYFLSVTDQGGCSDTITVTLNDPAALTLVCAQQNPVSTIGGSDGSATVQISGGTAAYTVAWSGAASGSQMQGTAGTATITGLIAGTYNVLVTDANGCEQTCTFSISSPACALDVTAIGTDPECNGEASGGIAVSVTSATGTLTFDWNDNTLDGTEDPTGLLAGSYFLSVTDQGGCSDTITVTLNDPAALTLVCAQQNPVSSIGGSDGSATVQISGGTAAYTVAWSGAASGSQNQTTAGTATITGLIAGTYNVLVTDANGCVQTCTFSISSPACALDVTAIGTDPECNGEASGGIAVSVTGATGTLTFDWNDNTLDGTEDPTGLLAGSYFLSVTDQGGCSDTITVTLTDPAALTLVCAQQNPVSSIGGSDGSATVQISGGTAGYTVAWSGAASGSQNQTTAGTATITGLIAGTYNVLVTDANGCEQTCTFSISSPACALDVTAIGTDPECNGEASGGIAVSVTGATGTLTFDWNDNTLDGTEDPTGLLAGTYFLSVTDQGGCSDTITVTLTDPAALTLVCAQQNPVSTIGGSDGSATVEISGGTAAYTVAWSGAASGSQMQGTAGIATITGLIAGTYNVLVTDANGCEQTCTFSISSLACALDVTALGTDPECNGEASGSIAVSVTGATGTLTFDWNDNTLDGTEDPTGLWAGTYFLSVTDQGGCSDTITVTLNDPAALTLVCAQQNPVSSIGGSDGSATVQISGGTAAYTVAWSGAASGSQNQTTAGTATITGLIAGTYNIVVTDANGCTQTCSFTITQPVCNLTLSATGTNPLCNGASNGSILLTVNGAIGTPTFDWSVNALDGIQNPTGLAAGTYSVTVTDAAGCQANTSVTLTNPAALTLVCAQQNPVSTIGGSNGSATVQVSGGTAGYSIAWSGAASGSQNQAAAGTATITGLIAGTYNIVVTDANGCTQTCSFTITQPVCNLTLSATGTNPLCNGASNGSISLTVNGATGTPTFDWSVNALDGIQNPTGLAAGTYSVTVTDAAGCTANTSVTLTNPAALTLVCAQQNPVSTIGGSNGSATVQISGGTATYTVAWSGAASGSQNQATAGTATITGLIAGTYNIVVTDANGCTQTCSFTITQPVCNLTLSATGTNPLCNGASNGSISLTVNGATGTPTFDWSVNALDGIQNPTGLAAGTYSVTVTDAAGCTANTSVTLTNPAALTLVCAQQNPVSTIGGSNGSATVQISGGTATYTVAWSGAASGSQNQATAGTATITGLIAGTYNIVVTDANGCTQTCSFTITQPVCNLTLSATGTNPLCNGASNGSISLTVNGAIGTPTFDWSVNALDGIQNPTGLAAGTYSVTVTDAAGCQANTSVTLTAPAALVFTASGAGATCVGAQSGSITIESIQGGTAPYEAWVNGAFVADVDALPFTLPGYSEGNYNIAVRDANQCEVSTMVNVPQPQVYTLDLGPSQTIRLGDSLMLNSMANFVIDSVIWSPLSGVLNPDLPETFVRPSVATTYRLIAFDSNGCSATDSVLVLVDRNSRIFVPNAFSPNDDNINDRLTVFSDAGVVMVQSYQIFDRWGNLMFSGGPFPPNDQQFGWDGNFKGRPMDAGVYVFWVELEFFDGRREVLSGEVTLMR
jgi:gliding motility-associated-like protein